MPASVRVASKRGWENRFSRRANRRHQQLTQKHIDQETFEMEQHMRKYTGENIDVTYEGTRCIHVGECLKRLNAVFDTRRRPWVLPDAGSPDNVAETVIACPSGALHFERKDGGEAESAQAQNTIRLVRNGPLHVRGDFTIVNGTGELVLKDTRAALCRCGGSANKPFCDNTHRRIRFVAPDLAAQPQPDITAAPDGSLCIETTTNGPLHITGSFTLLNHKSEPVYHGTDETLCRCGGSENKPFCDGTHEKNGFAAE
jgi:CDGSH-type Zn-finger protein/uncharacterized Fe-S cluster protein YjdI